jgi:hypothetical protein
LLDLFGFISHSNRCKYAHVETKANIRGSQSKNPHKNEEYKNGLLLGIPDVKQKVSNNYSKVKGVIKTQNIIEHILQPKIKIKKTYL